MSPRALAAWSFAALTIALSSGNPVYRALVFLCAINVLVMLRRPGVAMRPLMIALLIAGAVSIVVTTLLSHTGTHVLVTLPPGIPVFGGPLTLEAVVYGVVAGLGIAAAIMAAAPLTLVIEPHALVDALPRALARTGAAVGTSLNLIPAISRSAGEIRDAQRMRGWRPRRVREWPVIAVPVVLTALEGSMTLAEAMEARGYGAGTRTHFDPSPVRPADLVAAAVALLAAAGFIALRVAGAAADWYPFPTVTLPPVDLRAVLCCVALATPLLVWRRSR